MTIHDAITTTSSRRFSVGTSSIGCRGPLRIAAVAWRNCQGAKNCVHEANFQRALAVTRRAELESTTTSEMKPQSTEDPEAELLPDAQDAAIEKEKEMPVLWVHLADNPDFFRDFKVSKGDYIEATLYDGAHAEQGKGLWRIKEPDARGREGLWTSAKLIAVSDGHLYWWLTEGPGSSESRVFNLHFCVTVEKECSKKKRKPAVEFHTDYFRTLDAGDITGLKVPWFKVAPAKDDVEVEIVKLTGGAPRGRSGRKAGAVKPKQGDLDWEISDDDEMPEIPAAEAEGVKEKLAELKRQTAPKGDQPEKGKEKRKKKPSRSRSKQKSRRSRSSSRHRSKQKRALWFGKRKSESPRRSKKTRSKSPRSSRGRDKKRGKSRSTSSSDDKKPKKRKRSKAADRGPFGVGHKQVYDGKSSSSKSSDDDDDDQEHGFRRGPSGQSKKTRSKSPRSSRGRDKKRGKSRSTSSGDDKKPKKRKRSKAADRGPFGVGHKQRYDGKSSSSKSSDDDDDDQEQGFRRGPSGQSKHLQLQEYAEKNPGRLTARLLRKMQDILAREEGPPQHMEGHNLTPASATSSVGKALDLLAQGRPDRAADVLSQRYKALEMSLADQTWARAQFLELIPAEGASLVEKDEVLMAAKEQSADLKLRTALGAPAWKGVQKGEARQEDKGKGKGKGRGKKGRGPSGSWQAARRTSPRLLKASA
eukprot:s155_g23.t1